LSKAAYWHKRNQQIKKDILREAFSLLRSGHFHLLKKSNLVCYGRQMEPKRYRKKLASTVHPDTYWVVMALSEPDRKGHFMDEAIHGYMTTCYWFNSPDHGSIQLREQGSFYHFCDLNDEQQSPEFRTMVEALIWLRDTYPDLNHINIPKNSEVRLL